MVTRVPLYHEMGTGGTCRVIALFVAGLCIRVTLILYGLHQDCSMQVKYTDVDCQVFTDAARFVSQGASPYRRTTYHYTPLIAWMLRPNIYLTELFGKFIFVVCDVFAAHLIHKILCLQGLDSQRACWYCSFWLFNPLPMAVSSRGNAEAVLAMLDLSTLLHLKCKQIVKTALFYGLSVHLKIYPVTYALPMILSLQTDQQATGNDTQTRTNKDHGKKGIGHLSHMKHWVVFIVRLLNKEVQMFIFVAGLEFLTLGVLFYYSYGWEFLEQTYLYHLTPTRGVQTPSLNALISVGPLPSQYRL
ncbi:GPI mannosyltransferase 1-like [Narcine bancroftii]|uniref:GPI mannosyltransferase 1-like n=1 Tax=Narcine bancroftii TaxID=1343680 RepID=UPI003831BACF